MKAELSLHFRLASLLVLLALGITGCRQEMYNQARYKPLEQTELFPDGSSARPLPAHTVPRGELREDEQLYTGREGTNLVSSFPFPITRAVLDRGQERFDIYCSVCHGRTGNGRGMIVQRGFPAPPSFHIDRLREAPVGHFFDVMTRGYGVMYSYATRVSPEDRWAIAGYIRALQLSQHATFAEIPAEERAQLEAKTP